MLVFWMNFSSSVTGIFIKFYWDVGFFVFSILTRVCYNEDFFRVFIQNLFRTQQEILNIVLGKVVWGNYMLLPFQGNFEMC